MKRDVYEAMSAKIIAALEEGTVPWAKPWRSAGGIPVSLSTGRPYRGINILILGMEDRADPRWGTYNAIKKIGGQVRKGEHGTEIVFWKKVERREPKEGQDAVYRILKSYKVFNATQADGLPELPAEEERAFTPIETAEAIVNAYVWKEAFTDAPGPPVVYGFDQAAYSPARDEVKMPEPEQFDSDEAFYCTLFHELVHSTGHEKRLKRLEPAIFGSDPYAREELVAEIGSSFLAGVAGLESAGGEQSAAYVANWLERLRDDHKLVVQAAAQAQKAADLVLGTTFDDSRILESAEAVAA